MGNRCSLSSYHVSRIVPDQEGVAAHWRVGLARSAKGGRVALVPLDDLCEKLGVGALRHAHLLIEEIHQAVPVTTRGREEEEEVARGEEEQTERGLSCACTCLARAIGLECAG